MRKFVVCLLIVLLGGACGKFGTHSKGAVEQAIQDHLNQNSHLLANSFNTKLENVSFKGDTADALVRFESKQSAKMFVEVRYGLRLQNGHWEVVSSSMMSGMGGDFHAGGGTTPATGAQPAPSPLQPSHRSLGKQLRGSSSGALALHMTQEWDS